MFPYGKTHEFASTIYQSCTSHVRQHGSTMNIYIYIYIYIYIHITLIHNISKTKSTIFSAFSAFATAFAIAVLHAEWLQKSMVSVSNSTLVLHAVFRFKLKWARLPCTLPLQCEHVCWPKFLLLPQETQMVSWPKQN